MVSVQHLDARFGNDSAAHLVLRLIGQLGKGHAGRLPGRNGEVRYPPPDRTPHLVTPETPPPFLPLVEGGNLP